LQNQLGAQGKILQVLLHTAIQYVPFASRLTPYYVKAEMWEILKVRERYNLEILLVIHKMFQKHCPL
jgi:hypothetical protein